MVDKPAKSPLMNKELEKVDEQFKAFDEQVKSLTHDEMSKSPILETEPQTRMSTREAKKYDAMYIKPSRSMGSKEPFNEKFRDAYNQKKQYVKCIAENNEIHGEKIELWTKPFPGMPAEFWEVPVNKPVYVPGYVAERIAACSYHRLVNDDKLMTSSDGFGSYHGALVVKDTRHRLDCRPVGGGFVPMAINQ